MLMKWVKRIFQFLGSIYLAIILIAAAALFVIIGTFIESSTDSHLLAAQWTYHSWLFALLLCLFFVNILFAALRRWPFKVRHTPFLITHFGLLMIIGGTIIKNRMGLQGHLNVWEGSGNQQLILPHTHALHIESKAGATNLPINPEESNEFHQPNLNLAFKVVHYCPHVKEKVETWIKGAYAYLSGYEPIRVIHWDDKTPLTGFKQLNLGDEVIAVKTASFTSSGRISGSRKLTDEMNEAVNTGQMQELIRKGYLHNLSISISSKLNPEASLQKPLEEVIDHQIPFDDGILMVALSLGYSPIEGFNSPSIDVQWQSNQSKLIETTQISLQGSRSLYNMVQNDTCLGISRFDIDLYRPSSLLLLAEDEQEDQHLIAFDRHGRVHVETFRHSGLQSLLVYDQGFGGYAVQAKLPYPPFPTGRKEKELADQRIMIDQIRYAAASSTLAPPLNLFKQACEEAEIDFAETFVEFLSVWQQSYQLLFPQCEVKPALAEALSHVKWPSIEDREACQWICLLFAQLERPIRAGEDLLEFLKENRWPLLEGITANNSAEMLTLLSQQIFSISSQLPPMHIERTLSLLEQAKLLSAYFKAYGIDPRILQLPIEEEEESYKKFESSREWAAAFLETPLTIRYTPLTPPKKLEDRHPCILLEFRQGTQIEKIALAYQPAGFGLKQPILKGQYIVRYQPQTVEIPCRIRLRQARQIHYPHSHQPYSYESDILIAQQDEPPVEKTLSMNHVHETWDGYRFYLAGMQSSTDEGLKRVQIVVNHDPAKYLLTYPGALIVFLGIILLFWARPSRRK